VRIQRGGFLGNGLLLDFGHRRIGRAWAGAYRKTGQSADVPVRSCGFFGDREMDCGSAFDVGEAVDRPGDCWRRTMRFELESRPSDLRGTFLGRA
jgi:hypothetical protein